MTQQMKNAIAAMQRKAPIGASVWRNANGTFSHYRDANGEFATEDAARTDLRFCNEWSA